MRIGLCEWYDVCGEEIGAGVGVAGLYGVFLKELSNSIKAITGRANAAGSSNGAQSIILSDQLLLPVFAAADACCAVVGGCVGVGVYWRAGAVLVDWAGDLGCDNS